MNLHNSFDKEQTIQKLNEILSSASANGTESEAKNAKATSVDAGWREKMKNSEEKASSENEKKATSVDAGWREKMKEGESSKNNATSVDAGWRERAKASNTESAKKNATSVDPGWRRQVESVLDPKNVMEGATANYFKDIDEFKKAAAALKSIKSSKGVDYTVDSVISDEGGESIVLLCSAPDGKKVAVKIYFEAVNSPGSSIHSRSFVIEYMGSDDGKEYTLAVKDIGQVDFGGSEYYFEVTDYCEGGDLSDGNKFSFDEIVELVERLNEALHSIHENGILHRDIKPHNLFRAKHGVVLGDFGTAKVAEKGHAFQTSVIVGTDGYTAPELRLSITDDPTFYYTEKIDYYSLGVTLGTLFEGRFVYEGMNNAMIMRSVQKSRLPLRREDPRRAELENLLNGLCQYDPETRFGYEDVCKWLENHSYTGGSEDEWEKPFRIFDKEYYDAGSLFGALTKNPENWEKAKQLLYGNFFKDFFSPFHPELALFAQECSAKYSQNDSDKGLALFLKKLYAPGPIVWRGATFNSLAKIAEYMLVTKNVGGYAIILQKRIVSNWLKKTEGISYGKETLELVERIEDYAFDEPAAAVYWFGNCFADKKTLNICDVNVFSIKELIDTIFKNPHDFYTLDGHKKLYSIKEGPDLYGFLFSFGYYDLIELELRGFESKNELGKNVLLYFMLESIAEKEGIDTLPIKKFFVEYGPMGIYTYVRKLVCDESGVTYKALDSKGSSILKSIKNTSLNPETQDVKALYESGRSLIGFTEDLIRNVEDNPHIVAAGLYENKSILCTNIKGCFAYRIFDCTAPLGFASLL